MKGTRLEQKGYSSLIYLWLVQFIKTDTWLLGDNTFLQPKGVTMHAVGQSHPISKPYNNNVYDNPGN